MRHGVTGKHLGRLTGHPDEQQEMTKRHVLSVDKFPIDPYCNPDPSSEGQDQSCSRDKDRGFPIPPDDPYVDFHPDEKEEEDQADGCDEVEVRERSGREDVGCETRDPT